MFLNHVNPDYRALFRLTVSTGFRDDEVRHLSVVDVGKDSITVTSKPPGFCECCPRGWNPKNLTHRTVPGSKETVTAALEWISVRAKRTQSPANVWRMMQAAQNRLQLQNFSMHDLRRIYASNLLKVGVGISQISRLLGHPDAITTTRYLGIVEASVPVSQLLM